MIEKRYAFWSSDVERTKIHCREWRPEKEVKAVIQVAHGITEYMGRYKAFAEFMTERGIAVIGNDIIGHGASVSSKKEPMYLGGPKSWTYVVKDFNTCYEKIEEVYPGVPHIVLGFSMGSFIVRSFLIDYPNHKPATAILVGTGRISNVNAKIAKFLVKQISKKTGDDKPSKQINDFAFGQYNKKFVPNKTEFDWLCADETALQDYINDSRNNRFVTPGLFRELVSGMEYTCSKANIERMNEELRILLVSGEDDPVGENGKGVKKVAEMLEKRVLSANILLYPRARHDIFHEEIGIYVFQDLYHWMETRLIK